MEKAAASFRLAIRLNPSMALAYFSLGLFLASTGRPDDAISEIQKGMRLSPRDPAMWLAFSYLAFAHFAAERYEEAVDWAQQSVQQRPDFPLSYAYIAASYVHLDRPTEARAALEEVMRWRPDFSLDSLRPSMSGADSAVAARYFDGLRKAGLKE
jgi:tetratricopeptide (TPR) repeat protein